jgi:hypothetical protein
MRRHALGRQIIQAAHLGGRLLRQLVLAGSSYGRRRGRRWRVLRRRRPRPPSRSTPHRSHPRSTHENPFASVPRVPRRGANPFPPRAAVPAGVMLWRWAHVEGIGEERRPLNRRPQTAADLSPGGEVRRPPRAHTPRGGARLLPRGDVADRRPGSSPSPSGRGAASARRVRAPHLLDPPAPAPPRGARLPPRRRTVPIAPRDPPRLPLGERPPRLRGG